MQESTRQVRLSLEDLHRIKWILGGLLVLLACWALLPVAFGSEVLLLLISGLMLFFLFQPRFSALIPPVALRLLPSFLGIMIAIDLVSSAPDFLPAIIRMMLLLLLYRALPLRTGREDMQLLLLSLFCLIFSGVLTVSLGFAVQILLFSLISMALMFVVCMAEVSTRKVDTANLWKGFRWRGFLRRVWGAMNFRLLGVGVIFFAFLVTVSSLIFVLIPRFQPDEAWTFFQINTQAQSGFSETVSLGSVSEIALNDNLALSVDGVSEEDIPANPYWRMLVLDAYRNGEFVLSSWIQNNDRNAVRRRVNRRSLRDASFEFKEPDTDKLWTFYLEGQISRFLPIPGSYQSVKFTRSEDIQYFPQLRNIRTEGVSPRTFAYQLQGVAWAAGFPAEDDEVSILRTAMEEPAQIAGELREIYPYTTLDLGLSQRERGFLDQYLKALDLPEELSAHRFAEHLVAHFHDEFGYSLSPDIPEGVSDPIVRWLEGGNVGHCELFAGGFTLLARAAGYPTRVVVGFNGGNWSGVNSFSVRNRHAHAWVEIFDEADGMWLRFDPTPGGALGDADSSGDAQFSERGGDYLPSGLGAWVDDLRIIWYRRVVNFDEATQMGMARGLLDRLKGLQSSATELWERFKSKGYEWVQVSFRERSWSALFWVIFATLILATFWRFRRFFRFSMRSWFGSRQKVSHARKEAGRLLLKFRPLRTLLIGKKEVLDLEAERCARWKEIEDSLEALRYGPKHSQRTSLSLIKRASDELRVMRRFRRQLKSEVSK